MFSKMMSLKLALTDLIEVIHSIKNMCFFISQEDLNLSIIGKIILHDIHGWYTIYWPLFQIWRLRLFEAYIIEGISNSSINIFLRFSDIKIKNINLIK